MKKTLIIGGIGVAILGGVGTSIYFGAGEPKVNFDPAMAQVVVWNKPTTDAGWAEDVKAENFDIKSTDVLEKMKATHTEKLKRVEEGMAEIFDCPECIRFQVKKGHPDWSVQYIENYYQEQLSQANWEVEKLKQSIERMDKEIGLRKKGFVVVEGEETGLLGGKPYAIRKIND